MPELTWIGKEKVLTHHLDVPFRVLEHRGSYNGQGRHSEGDESQNMVIHGDNLEALKALLPRFEGSIDCIYIDPPYNTGNEGWVYNDSVNDPQIKRWLGEVVGKEGDDLSRHDKWLCMMYPRLRLLHALLAPTGVVFISIDDGEQASLRLICDEIFGYRNHITTFVWESYGHTDNQADVTNIHEYVHVYAKDKRNIHINPIVDPNIPEDSKIRRDFAENSIVKNGPKNPPSVVTLPPGFPCAVEELDLPADDIAHELMEEASGLGYISRELTKQYGAVYPVRLDPMVVRDGKLVQPCRVFAGWMNKNKLNAFIDNGSMPVIEGEKSLVFFLSHRGVVYYRREGRTSHYVQSILRNLGTTETNKYRLERMGLSFDYPKPEELIRYLISLYCPTSGIVLDSFAGSGTTAESVVRLNRSDAGSRRFILVELGEYASSLTAARVEQVIKESGNEASARSESFSYFELGEQLLRGGLINDAVGTDYIREYIWFTETHSTFAPVSSSNRYYLGTHQNTAYHLLYEQDKPTNLNRAYLSSLTREERSRSLVIFADTCSLSESDMVTARVTFKKIPRDISRL